MFLTFGILCIVQFHKYVGKHKSEMEKRVQNEQLILFSPPQNHPLSSLLILAIGLLFGTVAKILHSIASANKCILQENAALTVISTKLIMNCESLSIARIKAHYLYAKHNK